MYAIVIYRSGIKYVAVRFGVKLNKINIGGVDAWTEQRAAVHPPIYLKISYVLCTMYVNFQQFPKMHVRKKLYK